MKKLISILLCASLILGCVAVVLAETASGTTLALSKVEGKATIKNAAGKAVSYKENMKLYDKYSVETDSKSYAYISLDSKKAIKLDAGTEVSVAKAGKKLEVAIKKGQIYFNVEDKLKADESMNIRTNTMVTGIRGTKGVHGTDFIMLMEGVVETTVIGGETVIINAGEMFTCKGVKIPSFIDNSDNQNEQTDQEGLKQSVIPKLEQKPSAEKTTFNEADIPEFVKDDADPTKNPVESDTGNLAAIIEELDPAITDQVLTPPEEETGGASSYTVTIPSTTDFGIYGFEQDGNIVYDGNDIVKTLTVPAGSSVSVVQVEAPGSYVSAYNGSQLLTAQQIADQTYRWELANINSNINVTLGVIYESNDMAGLNTLLGRADIQAVSVNGISDTPEAAVTVPANKYLLVDSTQTWSGGTINNNGTIRIAARGAEVASYMLTVDQQCTLNNNGTIITNNGRLSTYGTITNNGTININETDDQLTGNLILNSGSITVNNGTIINNGNIDYYSANLTDLLTGTGSITGSGTRTQKD